MSSSVNHIRVSLAYGLCYLALSAASFGLWTNHHVLPWYPQAGLGLAVVLVFGRRMIADVAVMSTIAALFWNPAALDPVYCVGLGVTTGLGYGAGAEFLTRVVRMNPRLDRPRDVMCCIAVAFTLPLFVGSLGLAWFVAAGDLRPTNFLPALKEWWLGDAIGILSLMPALLIVVFPALGVGVGDPAERPSADRVKPRAVIEIAAQLAAIGLTLFVLFGWSATNDLHASHALFLPLIWIVSRHGLRGAAWGSALLSVGTNLSTLLFGPQPYTLLELQLLMIGMAVAGLLMGTVVSERERGKRALELSQRTNAAVLDAIPDLMFRMKRDGTYIDYHAPHGVRLLVPPEKFLNHTPTEVLEPSLAKMTMDSIGRALGTGGLAQGEYSVNGDLGQKHFETRVVPVGRDEVLCLVRDITTRKRLEADLIQSQKMDAVGQLAAGIAHDFNNLLSTIFGYVGIARAQLQPGDPTIASLDGVEASARHAAGVVRSLLTFTRKNTPEMRSVDFGKSVRRVAKLIRPTLPSSMSLTVGSPDVQGRNAEIWVRGDDTQLQQVALNLAINARDAMPHGGSIHFELGTEPPSGSGPGMARLDVIDSGVGMDAATAARIFEPFFSTKPKDESSGLGLAITEGIVNAHGGNITVRSEPGKGSTFTVRIPLDPGAPAAAAQSSHTPSDTNWVLVIDTHRQIREFLAASLSRAGFAVAQADGVDSARAALQTHSGGAAAIVSGDMDGARTVECVRELFRLRPELPIVVLASHPESVLDGEDEQIRAHVQVLGKPFQISDLATLTAGLSRARIAESHGDEVRDSSPTQQEHPA